jgi:hypothetical protein
MTSRLWTLLLLGGALALACGPRARSTDQPVDLPAGAGRTTFDRDKPLATSLNVSVRDGVTLALHVTNVTGKQLELAFASGQTHDFVVLDSAGRELWRWSSDRMFTQALQSKLLDPRETVSFEERWDPRGLRGTFTALGILKSTNFPLEERVAFTLP